jgi:NADPH:quinone reductase-like Zn-dependent oxidoreductase
MWCRPAALALNGTAGIQCQGTGARFPTPHSRRQPTDPCNKVALRPHIGEVLRLSNAAMAHRMLADGKHRAGKLVLVP